MQTWRRQVAELRSEGRKIDALALVREEVSKGNLAARVLLATMRNEAGLSRDEAERMIDHVEANMDPNDVEAHLELSSAYDVGLSNLPYDEKARRCFNHLLKAVELGAAPVHTMALARRYVMGTLVVKPNQKEAIRWYKHAIQQGSVEAVNELQRYYHHIEMSEKRSRRNGS